MIRHVVVLTLADGTEPAARDAMIAALRSLTEEIPEISSCVVGVDAGLAEGNAEVLLQLDFDDEGAWRRYQSHPAHKRVIADHIRPVLAARAAIQVLVT